MNAFHLFTLAGVPVRMTLGFLLLVAYYAYSLRGGGLPAIGGFLLAVVIGFLVHEFGHALVARRYKLEPQVVLHGWGGLCAHKRAKRDRDDAFIIAAGPLAGLALAGVSEIVVAVWPQLARQSLFTIIFFESMWLINFWWSLVNLLPLFPLDGGQLFRLGLLRVVKPARQAERIVHIVGITLAAAGLVYAIWAKSLLIGILTASLIAQNVRYLMQGSPIEVRARSALVDQLLAEARRTLAAGDAHEARRLAYQARDERTVTGDQVQAAFELLAVTSCELADWEEALDWAKRANATPVVDEARVTALLALKRDAEARHALGESKLGADARARIEARVGRALPS